MNRNVEPIRRRPVPAAVMALGLLLLPARLAADDSADGLLALSGIRGGLIVHLGCGDGRRTASLRAGDRYTVHGFDAHPEHVAAAREYVRRAGLAAAVWVDALTAARLPYGRNTVNLVVVEQPGSVGMDEVMRVLVPGGVALVRQDGRWERQLKPWPDQLDQWTHWLHGPDGNAVARDAAVGPPRRLQWIAAPLWSRSHDSVPSVTSMVSAGGRLLAIVDLAPASMSGAAPDQWALVARDAFNGLELWRRPLADWGWRSWARKFTVRFTIPTHVPRRLVAVGDRVYVTLGFNAPLTELDAATGDVLRTFDDTRFTDEILCLDGTLILAINQARQGPGDPEGTSPPVHKSVAAVDVATGKTLWKTGDYVGLRSKTGAMDRISHLSMVAGDGQVFFVDRDRIVSLNVADGSQRWRVPRPAVPEYKMRYDIRITDMCTLVYHDGILFFAQPDPDRRPDWRELRAQVHAVSAKTGEVLWTRPCSSWGWAHPADVFAIGDLVWISGFKDDFYYGLDPRTGAVERKVSNFKAFDNGHHHRCYRNKATTHFLMTGFRGVELIDVNSAATDRNHWVRGTCRLGPIPCNGLIYASPHPCDCYITSKLNGFVALAPEEGRTEDGGRRTKQEGRLERGTAYGEGTSHPSGPGVRPSEDWPTYRHDAGRSGATTGAVPKAPALLWERKLDGQLTAPVVAEGRLVLARRRCREVVALDAVDGHELWRFVAGGFVDTPPTLRRGRVVFGCADGSVYCLRATDGALAWRFQAAPAQRLIGAFGHIESAWPVHGSVLLLDDVLYCTAGRSSFLDGGIDAWGVELESGKVVAHEHLASAQDMDVDWGRDQTHETGVLSDILVAWEGGVYMRQHRLFAGPSEHRIARHLHATGGLLDRSWFHRTRWFLDGVPFAEYLVFDDHTVWGVRARKKIGGYGGHFTPGAQGFGLFAADRMPLPPRTGAAEASSGRARRPPNAARDRGFRRGASQTPTVRAPRDRWTTRIPVRPTAMAIAADTLIVAGTPDELCADDPWAAYEGRRGGRLLTFSAADGAMTSDRKLDAAPVADGIAVAAGRLYLTNESGKVLCLGDPHNEASRAGAR